MQLSLPLLALSLLSALTVVRALPVEREAQKDERVTRCIIEALSNALAKENVPPVTSECREILKGGKHEVAGKKNEGEKQHYEEDRHLEESEKHHFGEKGSLEELERHAGKYYEGDEQNKDENEEEQHYKQTHDDERSNENNSEEDNRSKEVKSNHHVRGHRDQNSNKEYLNYEERRYAAERREGDEEEQPRKWRHSEEDSGLADNSSQKSDNSEITSNRFHLKWPHRYDKTNEESSEEDKAIGLHGHTREITHSEEMYSDRGMDGSDGTLNNQGKVNGIYEHKKSNSEESEEEGSEEREKRLDGHIHYYKRNNHSHSEEARRNPQQYKKNTGKSDESSEELEHINSIRSYHKRNNVQEAYEKGKHYYEDEVNGYLGSHSEESEEDKQHHDKRTFSEEKSYYGEEKKWHNIEEEKRHHNRNTRHHSEEEEVEEENKYHSEEKRHLNEEDKRHNHNEMWHQTEEDAEEKNVNNEEGDEEERNTKHFPKMQQVWWHRMEDRSPGSEEETRYSKESHIYPEYEENNDIWEKRHYEKQREEEDGGQEEEVNEGHALRQSFADDFPEKRMYDRMEKLAHYLKSKKKSLKIPELYDFEEEDEKPHHEDEKRNMSHRTLTEEEEKELENLAAMDLELEKMAEKLHGNQRV